MANPELLIPVSHGGNRAPAATVDPNVDLVNPYLVAEFQTPMSSLPTEVTPGTLPMTRPFKASSAGPSPSGFKTPGRRNSPLSNTQAQLRRQPLVSRAQESASCSAPLPVPCHPPRTPVKSNSFMTPGTDNSFMTPVRVACFAPDQHSALSEDDHLADQEVQEVQTRPGSVEVEGRSCAVQTLTRGSALFAPISPLGRSLQYPPETVKLSVTPTPTPVKDRSFCVPCQCPKPRYPWTIQQYRLKYPYFKYAGGPGNGSVLNQKGFFKYGSNEGRPFEKVTLLLQDETSAKAPRKQRVEDHKDLRKFNLDGEKKPGGPPPKHAKRIETEDVDVQLISVHHPQYCLQYSNFLPRLHELRPNLCGTSIVNLWRHVCPTVPINQHVKAMDEAIPRLLVHSSLQDSWAIALLVRFTTSRNPCDGIQTDNCLMNLASQDFDNRSGNHIMMKHDVIPFGSTFDGIGLPKQCFTNCTFPQLCVVYISSLLLLSA
jgi:hypothetical protein